MISQYILNKEGQPEPCPDTIQWGQWMQSAHRSIAHTIIDDGIFVSTVFLGIDHNFLGSGPPILWETMIFGGQHDQYQDRYTSKEDALKGHEIAVNLASTKQ